MSTLVTKQINKHINKICNMEMQGKVPHTLMSLLGRVMELERIKRKGGDEIKSILDVGAEKKA